MSEFWLEKTRAATTFEVARQFTSDGSRKYLVWVRRGGSTVVSVFEAVSAEDAKRQAREELENVEALLNTV
jgi:hypothetical protein